MGAFRPMDELLRFTAAPGNGGWKSGMSWLEVCDFPVFDIENVGDFIAANAKLGSLHQICNYCLSP